jgi:hypothetical protein
MNQKDEDIAHPGMVSKPEKTPNFGPNSVIRHGQVNGDKTRSVRIN